MAQETLIRGFHALAANPFPIENPCASREQDGRVSRLLAYTFCPETVRAVGGALGYDVRTGLYRPSSEPPLRRVARPARLDSAPEGRALRR